MFNHVWKLKHIVVVLIVVRGVQLPTEQATVLFIQGFHNGRGSILLLFSRFTDWYNQINRFRCIADKFQCTSHCLPCRQRSIFCVSYMWRHFHQSVYKYLVISSQWNCLHAPVGSYRRSELIGERFTGTCKKRSQILYGIQQHWVLFR